MTFDNESADFSSEFMGGGFPPAVAFTEIGDSVTGIVTRIDKKPDTTPEGNVKTWPDGSVMHVYIFTLDVNGEERALWVRGNMITAIRNAVTEAGLNGPLNTKLTVQYNAVGEPKVKGYKPPKLFRAKCEPAPARTTTVEEPW